MHWLVFCLVAQVQLYTRDAHLILNAKFAKHRSPSLGQPLILAYESQGQRLHSHLNEATYL